MLSLSLSLLNLADIPASKSTRVEIYSFEGDGLSLKWKFPVYGRITALLTLRPADAATDHLFVASDNNNYFTVSWDPVLNKVRNEHAACDVSDRFLRGARCGPLYLADPGGRLLGLHVYQGTFLSIPLVHASKKGKQRKTTTAATTATTTTRAEDGASRDLGTASPIRFSELDVLDMAFLYETKDPVLAVLYNNTNPEEVRLKTYEVTHSGTGFSEWRMKATALEAEPRMIIPVAGPIGGLLVLGTQMVYYFGPEDLNPLKQRLRQFLAFVTWGMIDAQRYLLGDEHGKLHIIFLELDNCKVLSVKVEEIGQVSQVFYIYISKNSTALLIDMIRFQFQIAWCILTTGMCLLVPIAVIRNL